MIWPKFDEKHILGVNDLTISQFSVLVVAVLFPVESGHWIVICMTSALHHITILLLLQLKMATLYKVLCSSLPEAKDETFLMR